jgi:alpha-tubulin suppressor-like RCC1 family protein
LGQIGLGTLGPHVAIPTQIPNTQGFISVSAGDNFTLALTSDGRVWAYGLNSYGQVFQTRTSEYDWPTHEIFLQLGLGYNENCYTPTHNESLPNILRIEAGHSHSLALDSDYTLWSFGRNRLGQLGTGSAYSHSLFPMKVKESVRKFAVGHDHTLVIDSQAQLFGFGYNCAGQLGLSMEQEICAQPMEIPGFIETEHVVCGGHCSYVTKADGTVWVMGANFNGTLALQHCLPLTQPAENPRLQGMEVLPGGNHLFCIDASGRVYACGYNVNGLLGLENLKIVSALTLVDYIHFPRKISPVKSAKQINFNES